MKALPRTFIVTGINTPWNENGSGRVIYHLSEDVPDANLDALPGTVSTLSLTMRGTQAQRFPAVGSKVQVDIRINEV